MRKVPHVGELLGALPGKEKERLREFNVERKAFVPSLGESKTSFIFAGLRIILYR